MENSQTIPFYNPIFSNSTNNTMFNYSYQTADSDFNYSSNFTTQANPSSSLFFPEPIPDLSDCENSTNHVLYISFQDLMNYPSDTNLEVVCEQVNCLFEDSQDWKNNFEAINHLRILNKFHPEEINPILEIFWPKILQSFDSPKSPILKNILLFCKELLQNAEKHKISDEAIALMIPLLMSKVSTEKSFIKQEIESIVTLLTTYCCYDSSIQALAQICLDAKKQNQHEASFFTLMKMADNIGGNLPKLNEFSLKCLMVTIGSVLESGKKGVMKKWGTMLCQTILNLFGPDDYLSLVKNTTQQEYPQYFEMLVKAVSEKKDSRRSSNIGEFITAKKRMMKWNPIDSEMRMGANDQIREEENEKRFKSFASKSCMKASKNVICFPEY